MAGAGAAVAYLIPWSMMPDVIEFDELKTGLRREGIFYGFMVFLQKTSIAIAIFLVGRGLSLAGYITPTEAVQTPVQPESALETIRLFIGPVPAVILAISLVIVYFYPISRKRHLEAREELALRHESRPKRATPGPVSWQDISVLECRGQVQVSCPCPILTSRNAADLCVDPLGFQYRIHITLVNHKTNKGEGMTIRRLMIGLLVLLLVGCTSISEVEPGSNEEARNGSIGHR